MKKALAQNPNMLRTMVGLGLTLILILSYAVYGATMDSSYYLYNTTNESVEHNATNQGLTNQNTTQTWTFSTFKATTWLNVTFVGVEPGDTVSIEVSDGVWYHHEMLGSDDAERFSCRQNNEQNYEEYNVCTASKEHSITAEQGGNLTFRGIVHPELPMGGLGSLFADSMLEAEEASAELISKNNRTLTWVITLSSSDSIHPDEFAPVVQSTSHDLESVEVFKVDPVEEMLWSVSALIGCFSLALVVPLTIYFAARAKEIREDKVREAALQKLQDNIGAND
ncbi:MAG: hypothetical protein VYA86_01460 [Candidatus Thermoplasmatota archaeon]|nr:hypothetical protein [Candidatus Thermoplasmatota archaeon]